MNNDPSDPRPEHMHCPTCGHVVAKPQIFLDEGTLTAHFAGHRAKLRRKSFAMMKLLVRQYPRVVSEESLKEKMWGDRKKKKSDSTFRVNIHFLRKELAPLRLEITSPGTKKYRLALPDVDAAQELLDSRPPFHEKPAMGNPSIRQQLVAQEILARKKLKEVEKEDEEVREI